jgi:hypothetical protein
MGAFMAKSDPTKAPAFQKVVGVFLNTPHQPHKPTAKKAKSPRKKRASGASAKPKTEP